MQYYKCILESTGVTFNDGAHLGPATIKFVIASIVVTALFAISIAPARAQQSGNEKICALQGYTRPDERIVECTSIIERSGALKAWLRL